MHDSAFLHEHRRFLIRPAAEGKRGVDDGLAIVLRCGGVEALGFVEDGTEVGEGFELGEAGSQGDAGAVDFVLEFGEDVGPLGEGEEEAGEEGFGGVAAGEEDVEEFGAESRAVLGRFDDFREEGFALVRVLFGGGEGGVGGLFGGDGVADYIFDVGVHDLFVLFEAGVWEEE